MTWSILSSLCGGQPIPAVQPPDCSTNYTKTGFRRRFASNVYFATPTGATPANVENSTDSMDSSAATTRTR